MYRLNHYELLALRRIEHLRERLFVQRLLELAHPNTHPYYLRGTVSRPLSFKDLCSNQLDQITIRATLSTADQLHGQLITKGGSNEWLIAAYRNLLLDRNSKHTGTSFQDRLHVLVREPDRSVQPKSSVDLRWCFNEVLAGTPIIPGGHARLTTDPPLKQCVEIHRWKDRQGAKHGALRPMPYESTGVRDRLQLAAQLRSEGTVLLDIMRVTNPATTVSLQDHVDVLADGRGEAERLNLPPIPRLPDGRLDSVFRIVLDYYRRSPFDTELRRILNSVRWFATFCTRWREAPTFATPMLYMALEALGGRCVADHHIKCRDKHDTAANIYAARIRPLLTQEFDIHLQYWKGKHNRQESAPSWSNLALPRFAVDRQIDITTLQQLHERLLFMVNSEPTQVDDPMLLCRIQNLMDSTLEDKAMKHATSELHELRRARNGSAHAGRQIPEEHRARQLASIGIEVLCSALDEASQKLSL